jgi:hypothetical protein
VPPNLLRRADVHLLAVLQQLKRLVKPQLGQLVVGAGQLQQALGVPLFDRQSLLPLFQVANGQRLGKVGVDQLLLLRLQSLQPATLAQEELLIVGPLLDQLGLHGLPDGGNQPVIQPDGRPVTQDVTLHHLHGQERQVADRALLVPAKAVEVGVDGAALALGIADGQARVALGAEQAALQVVVVAPGTVTGDPAASQDVLHLMPSLFVDQRLMLAGILNPAVRNHAGVIRAGQDAVHLTARQRHGRSRGSLAGAHAAALQLFDEVGY